jgi:hypothetical protein
LALLILLLVELLTPSQLVLVARALEIIRVLREVPREPLVVYLRSVLLKVLAVGLADDLGQRLIMVPLVVLAAAVGMIVNIVLTPTTHMTA